MEVRPGLGDLGDRLDAGETATDDDHGRTSAEIRQPSPQAQRRLLARDVTGVLGNVGGSAAEGVDEGVVSDLAAVGVHDLAFCVDAVDPRDAHLNTGAREDVRQPARLQVLTGRQLVHAHPLDELRVGVDEGDLGVGGVQPPGEASCRGGSGVSGPENDDAVLHGFAPVWLVSLPEPGSGAKPDRSWM